MAFLTFLAYEGPTGFWETPWAALILGLFDFIKDYGWRIVLFTLILKLLLSPLDIYQRVAMRKNQRITERLKPDLEKLEKQYSSNPKVLQAKKAELNKREGVKMAAGCLPMLLTLIISMWLLMGGLNPISQYKNMEQYLKIYEVYTAAETAEMVEHDQVYKVAGGKLVLDAEGYPILNFEFEEEPEKLATEDLVAYNALLDEFNRLEAIAISAVRKVAQDDVVEAYWTGKKGFNDDKPIQEGFLWVKNIWVTDAPWAKPVMDETAFLTAVAAYGKSPSRMHLEMSQREFDAIMEKYSMVTEKLVASEDNKSNGFLVLPILSIAVSIGSQMLMRRLQKKSGQLGTGAGQGKMMAYMMPVMFGVFALMFTTAFSLYMITNSLVMIIISLAASFIMRLSDKRGDPVKQTDEGVVRYGRPDPNKK